MSTIDWSKAPEGTSGAMVANFNGGTTHVGKVEFIPSDERNRDMYSEGADAWTYFPAPKPWDGQGLPSVGTVCEVDYCESWQRCEVIAHFSQRCGMVAAFTVEFSGCAKSLDAFSAEHFRPARTPEQIAADERLHEIRNALTTINAKVHFPNDLVRGNALAAAVEAMIDAGYRKQVMP